MLFASPWCTPNIAPTEWARAWTSPTWALENALPAMLAEMSICPLANISFRHLWIEDGNIGKDIVIPEEQLSPLLMIFDHRNISDFASRPCSCWNHNVWCLGPGEDLKPCIILKSPSLFHKDCHPLRCIDGTASANTDETIGPTSCSESRPLIDDMDARVRFHIRENPHAQTAKNF